MKEARATLVWFRRDLRLKDNPALLAAARRGPVVPVFIWSPEEEAPWEPGAASRWWLHRSLESLDASLRGLGLRLVLRRGPAAEALAALARETGAGAAAWSRVWEPALRLQESRVRRALEAQGAACLEQPANLLFEPPSILTQEGRPYRVFTPFWNRCARAGLPARPRGPVRLLRGTGRPPASLPLEELGLLPGHPRHRSLEEAFLPGEAGAWKALGRFIRRGLADYRRRRDFPAADGASRLSPRLHFGELAVERVWWEASSGAGDPGERGGFLGELGWRDFAAYVLHHFPETAGKPLDPRFERFAWRDDPAGLEAWKRGRTGFPMVDAGMRELWSTGWMHNRVRMVAASFLTKDLLVDWREGARWFWETLVDADLASNTLGWQWAAGCGADAAPFFRIFNPQQQLERWDEDGAYTQRWLAGRGPAPQPILDHGEARRRALRAFSRAGEARAAGRLR